MKEKGFALIILLIIVIVGVVIGVVVYTLSNSQSKIGSEASSKTGNNGILQTVKEKIIKPKPLPAVETGSQTTQASPTSSQTPYTLKANFSHEGAFFAREGEDGWTFLWDEPGRLALNVNVKFTDQSICILGGEKKDCGLINMGPQSYDRVSLEGERSGDEVTVTKLEEVKMPE